MCDGAGTLYVPATSWCAMASNKPLPLAVVSIIRYSGKHDSASQAFSVHLHYWQMTFFSLPKIRGGAPGAPPPLDPLLLGVRTTQAKSVFYPVYQKVLPQIFDGRFSPNLATTRVSMSSRKWERIFEKFSAQFAPITSNLKG